MVRMASPTDLAPLVRTAMEYVTPGPVMIAQSFWLRSDHEGYWYPAVSVGETVRQGQDLGHVADFQGNVLQPVACPADGVVLFLVSSLAMNPGDPLLSVGA